MQMFWDGFWLVFGMAAAIIVALLLLLCVAVICIFIWIGWENFKIRQSNRKSAREVDEMFKEEVIADVQTN